MIGKQTHPFHLLITFDLTESVYNTRKSTTMDNPDISQISINDLGGQTMPLTQYKDMRLPPIFPAHVMPHLPRLKLRGDDIIMVTYMRSGTHWMFELIGMLLNNKPETVTLEKRDQMLEYNTLSDLDKLPSKRVLNTHLQFKYLPEDLKTVPCKIIYSMRDPRDALVSWFKLLNTREHYQYKGEFHNWLPVNLQGEMHWGSWFDHVRDWEKTFEKHPNMNVHYWFYEDMLKDPVGELRKLSEFLGTSTDESLLKAIVDKCSIDRMRVDKNVHEKERTCEVHYVTGMMGGWKKMFTVSQYEEFEKVYREKMTGSRFYGRYVGSLETL